MNEFLTTLGFDFKIPDGPFTVEPLTNNTISLLLNSNLVQLQSITGADTDEYRSVYYKVVSKFMPSYYKSFISLNPSVAPYPSVSRVVRERIGDLIFIVYSGDTPNGQTFPNPISLSDFENLNSAMGSYVSKSFSMQYGEFSQLFVGVISNDYNALDNENTLDYVAQIAEDYNIYDYTIIRPGTSQSIRQGFLLNSVENGTILNAGVINPQTKTQNAPTLGTAEDHGVKPPKMFFGTAQDHGVK